MMAAKDVYDILSINSFNTSKVLWVGDKYQLPPIKSDISVVFDSNRSDDFGETIIVYDGCHVRGDDCCGRTI